eukprot:TRINITY_DN28095_c0_g2_i1.p1 TRINITY_DN28095_c0_g2~~TRINITY_DN28095_c0_g2_i1.p1  ORF type:complete len:381 (-),score=56.98 TRINITY_DN28095_c0_g2_i1:252-1394(-)
MTFAQEGAHRAALRRLNALFMDEESKDVTFKLVDGEERAHKAVLRNMSEVFKGMFSQEMREKQEGVVEVPDVDKTSMRVFLRLLYTGHVDEADFAHQKELASQVYRHHPVRVLQQASFSINGSRLTSTDAAWQAGVVLDSRMDGLDFIVSTADPNAHFMMGVVPMDATVNVNMYYTSGAWIYVHTGHVQVAYPNNQSLPNRPRVVANSELRVAFDASTSSLLYSVDGGIMQVAAALPTLPHGAWYRPAITAYTANTAFDVKLRSPCAGPTLQTLLSVTRLAKKYMVRDVLSTSTQALKTRLEGAKAKECVRTFEAIISGAISCALDPLRFFAVKLAEDFSKLREEYIAGSLKPEVMHEFELIWPQTQAVADDNMSLCSLE